MENDMIENSVAPHCSTARYTVLCIDPPWPKKKGGIRFIDKARNAAIGRDVKSRELEYDTMSVAEIFELLDHEIFPLAENQHTVFLWGIDQFLHEGERQMLDRGYRMHARLIWDKENGIAPAFSLRYSHEYVTWFYKPKFTPVSRETRGKFRSVICEAGRQHSRKPDGFYKIIEAWFPDARRLDVFSRENRNGWQCWGNQIGHFKSES